MPLTTDQKLEYLEELYLRGFKEVAREQVTIQQQKASRKPGRVLTPKEAAAATGLSAATITNLCHATESGFPVIRVGRNFKIPEEQLAIWIEEQSKQEAQAWK